MPVGITLRLTLWKALSSLVLGALAVGVALSITAHGPHGYFNNYIRCLLFIGGVLMLTGIVGLFVLCCLFCESCSWSSVKQDVTFHYQKQEQEQQQQQQRQQPTQQPVKTRSRGLRKQQRTESRLPLLESGDEPQPGPSGEQNPVLKRGSSSKAETESSGDEIVKFENNFKKTIPCDGHCKNKSLPEPYVGYKSLPRPSGKGSRFTMLKHQTRSVPGLPGDLLMDTDSEDTLGWVPEQVEESQC